MKNLLSAEDMRSSAWHKIKKYYEERLQSLRMQNDSNQLTQEKTAQIRGQISEIKILLALGIPAPTHEAEEYPE